MILLKRLDFACWWSYIGKGLRAACEAGLFLTPFSWQNSIFITGHTRQPNLKRVSFRTIRPHKLKDLNSPLEADEAEDEKGNLTLLLFQQRWQTEPSAANFCVNYCCLYKIYTKCHIFVCLKMWIVSILLWFGNFYPFFVGSLAKSSIISLFLFFRVNKLLCLDCVKMLYFSGLFFIDVKQTRYICLICVNH